MVALIARSRQLTISTLLLLQMAAVQKAARASDHSTTRISMQPMCVIPMGTSVPRFAAALLHRSDHSSPTHARRYAQARITTHV
jgi:hypothetical protein